MDNKEMDEDNGLEEIPVLSSSSDESDDEGNNQWQLTCICGQKEDDGELWVQCDQCILRWEHVDCIFPRTKKAPDGNYFCHVCKPRPTELSREQARMYQDLVQMEKDGRISEMRRKLDEAAKKAEKSVTDIVQELRTKPRVRSQIMNVNPLVFGLVATEAVCEGAYIAELRGDVRLEKDCPNKDFLPRSPNERTFSFENGDDMYIIDVSKGRDATRHLNVRRSCKPNAAVVSIGRGSEMHVMLRATKPLKLHDEVSIKLEQGWMSLGRPGEECGCDKSKGRCLVERYYTQFKPKRGAIANDDSASEQPIEKRAKSEESECADSGESPAQESSG